jgi:hypothetical protein
VSAELRLGPIPKTVMVKMTISVPVSLRDDLDLYAELHSARWGETIDGAALAPHILQAFLARDRGFKRSRGSDGPRTRQASRSE